MKPAIQPRLWEVEAFVVGVAVALAAWLLLVPWDLSELDASGAMIEGGGDDNAGGIAVVALVLLVIGLALTLVQETSPLATVFTVGGYATWAALFAWRAGSARVSGANLYMVPLVIIVIPAAILAPLIVRSVARRRAPSPSNGG